MDLSLFFAGTGGSVPGARRGLPALLLSRGADRLLFDCGEGTQRQLIASVGLHELDAVFITHFHADHWLGLPGLLKTFALRERERPLTVYGPSGLKQMMTAMQAVGSRLSYELKLCELERWEEVARDGYLVAAIPVTHGQAPAFGYSIVEQERPGHFDPRAAAALGVVPGPDFGRLQAGETVGAVTSEQVMGPPRAGRRIVLSGDSAPCETLAVAAHDADVLVHEATFVEQDARLARSSDHSTARHAAELARDARVRMLALTHISSRYPSDQVRDEARAVFAATEVLRDFDTIEVPFPERGAPTLLRWRERQARERGLLAEPAARSDTASATRSDTGDDATSSPESTSAPSTESSTETVASR